MRVKKKIKLKVATKSRARTKVERKRKIAKRRRDPHALREHKITLFSDTSVAGLKETGNNLSLLCILLLHKFLLEFLLLGK